MTSIVRSSLGCGTVSFVFERCIKNVINDLIDVIFVCKGFEVLSNVLKEVISESIDKNVTNAMNDQRRTRNCKRH